MQKKFGLKGYAKKSVFNFVRIFNVKCAKMFWEIKRRNKRMWTKEKQLELLVITALLGNAPIFLGSKERLHYYGPSLKQGDLTSFWFPNFRSFSSTFNIQLFIPPPYHPTLFPTDFRSVLPANKAVFNSPQYSWSFATSNNL